MYIIVVYETQQLLEFVEKNFDPGWKPTQGKPVSLPDGIVFILKKCPIIMNLHVFINIEDKQE